MADRSPPSDGAGAERLGPGDRRFIAACLIVIVAGAAITAALFRRAFPEASIEFRVNRAQARTLAEEFLAKRAHLRKDSRFAGRFSVDDDPKVYLERELGLEKAGRLYGTEARVWRWDMRWFRSGETEQENVSITPRGDLVGFEFVRKDDAPGPRPGESETRALASAFLAERGLPPDALKQIEATPVSRPNRTDWNFVDERIGSNLKDATVRYSTTVAAGEVSAYREFVHVPEAWERDYRGLRSKNETAGAVATLGLFVTVVAMLVGLVRRIVRKDVRWKLVAGFGLVALVLSLLSTWNGISLTIFDEYDTASSFSSFLTSKILLGFLGAIAVGAGIAFVVASAEPEYRERFGSHLSLSGLFSRRGIGTKRFFLGVLLGWALVAFFFAYQAVFYVVAERFGAWSPADIPYSDMLNTAVPWATVLLIGFLPAVSEEGISRMFSISFLSRLGAGRFLAVVVPALIWGFGHAAYPNQPFYIRGLEVGLAGVLIGAAMLRFGVWPLLVWHFSVDAIYTALLLLRSGNAYYVVSGAISAGILLVPLAVSLLLYARRGGFAVETGLTNRDEGTAPEPEEAPAQPAAAPSVRPLSSRVRVAGIVIALVLAGTFLLPSSPPSELVRDDTGRARALELSAAFLRANSVRFSGDRDVTYPGTGFAESEDVRAASPEEHGRIPGFSEAAAKYVLKEGGREAFDRLAGRSVPVALWVTRFFQPEKKEEWKVLVDAKRARVVGFVHPREEAAPAEGALSPERARERAFAAAEAFGYPAGEYHLADLGTKDRPKRRDTTVILESRPPGVGEARPRLTAVFQGSRLSAFLPSLRVPETFLREYRKRSSFDWLLLGLRVVAIGGIAGGAFVLFLRRVRSPGFRWREIAPPVALASLLGAVSIANGIPSVFRAYPTEYPLRLFLISTGAALLIAWLAAILGACVGFVLIGGARPGWRSALRGSGSLSDALLRAAVAAAGLAGLSHLGSFAAEKFPAVFPPDPQLPAALAGAFPAISAFWSAARDTFSVATLAAVVALAAKREFFRKPLGAVLGIGALAATALPSQLSGAGEFAAAFVPALAAGAWLGFSALFLLADHAAAWIFFGIFAFGGPTVVELLSQGARADRVAGGITAVLLAVAAVVLLAGRRRSQATLPAEAAAPPPFVTG